MREIGGRSRQEVIDDQDVIAVRSERLDKMRADETRTTRDQNAHR